jgi:hypothetical protein
MSSLQSSKFGECVKAAIRNWDIVRGLVANEAGGSDTLDKANWLPTVIIDLFAEEGTIPCEIVSALTVPWFQKSIVCVLPFCIIHSECFCS